MIEAHDSAPAQGRRVRWIHLGLLSAALAFGSLGVFATQGYISASLQNERARMAADTRTIGVIVAASSLPAGETVSVETMAVRQIPARLVDDAMVRADAFEHLIGRELALPMASGEPLRQSALRRAAGPFSARVAHGIRAMTIEVDEVNSVSGMLRPGDRIDLLFATRAPAGHGSVPGGAIAAPLMQDLLVLATGAQAASPDPYADPGGQFRAITVEVTPTQAQKLVLAQRSGRLTALLRNPEDRHDMPAQLMDLNMLLGLSSEAPRRPSVAGPEIIVGGQGPITRQTGTAILMSPP
ncbi:MAG: Flp pilus assembly protein CpaB [Burkholderiaceae bacterium]